MKALVVDDSRAMRAILKKILVGMNVEVTEAEHGVAALAILESQKSEGEIFDFALFDWNMPEMDGLELVKRVRANERLGSMQIMMVTTETEMKFVERALEAGANEYLMKPFDQSAVREKLALLGIGEVSDVGAIGDESQAT
jgi:two-component system chemotaxis response regulator CheY